MVRAGIAAIGFLSFLGACLLVPAGRIAWPAAWAFLAVFAGFTLATFAFVSPDLVRERAAPGSGSNRVDVLLASLGFLGLYPGTLLVAGLDAGRFGSSAPALGQVTGLLVFTAGYGFAFWAMRENPFFATFVRIQAERGHRVVRSGPYAWVRHPGYTGAILAHLALPLALGSYWALVPASLGALLFGIRTAHEDRVLSEQLDGYTEYQARVPWRLLPHVW